MVEAAIAYALAWAMRWECRGALHVAAGSAAATAITHPQLWALALWAYDRYPYWPSVVTLEALVVLIEGPLIAWMAMLRLDRAILVSLAANSGSLALGLLIGC